MERKDFLSRFLCLAAVSGVTIGMSKLITTFHALDLGATPSQVGLISAAEALGMVVLTLPAGLLIDRFGSRRLYVAASLVPAFLHAAILFWADWVWLAVMRLLIGTCVPFRSVAMNSLYLKQLPIIGLEKAGWFRAALMVGMLLVGPWLGGKLHEHIGVYAYLVAATSFAVTAFWGRSLWDDELVTRPTRSGTDGFRSLLKDSTLRSSCLIEFTSSATSSVFGTFLVILCVDELHWSQGETVNLVAFQGLVTVFSLFFLSRPLSGLTHRRIYLFALSCGGLAFMSVGWFHSAASLVLAGIVLSLSTSSIHLANLARISRLTLNKGGVSGLFGLSQTTGMLTGGLVGSLLAYLFGLSGLFPAWLGLVLFIATIIGMAKLIKSQ